MLNQADKLLHDAIHTQMLKQNPENILNNDRLRVFKYFEKICGPIHGNILDIGAGNGYASIWVAKNCSNIQKVIALEASQPAVDELIPRNVAYYQVQDKVIPTYGSFDSFDSGQFDFIIALGAIHHSRDLNQTMRNIGRLLKPGGFLIAQEPAMPDETTHDAYQAKYDIVEERFGLKIRNGDRHDHFFRECEYKCTAVYAGMDIIIWEDWKTETPASIPQTRGKLRQLVQKFYNLVRIIRSKGYRRIVKSFWEKPEKDSSKPNWQDMLSEATRSVSPKFFVLKKSSSKSIYHKWNGSGYD